MHLPLVPLTCALATRTPMTISPTSRFICILTVMVARMHFFSLLCIWIEDHKKMQRESKHSSNYGKSIAPKSPSNCYFLLSSGWTREHLREWSVFCGIMEIVKQNNRAGLSSRQTLTNSKRMSHHWKANDETVPLLVLWSTFACYHGCPVDFISIELDRWKYRHFYSLSLWEDISRLTHTAIDQS